MPDLIPLESVITGESDDAQEPQNASQSAPSAVPPHVWRILQESGERSAERLLDMFSEATWRGLRPGDKIRLIELAQNRAYGPPIKREQRVELSGRITDEVAASLARLSAADLPEMKR